MTTYPIERAAHLWNEGAPDAVVAIHLGISVADFRRMSSLRPDLFDRRKHEEAPKRAASTQDPVKGLLPPRVPGTYGVPDAFMMRCMCKFPLWGSRERPKAGLFLFCGEPTDQGKTYCAFHTDVCRGTGTPSERRADKMPMLMENV